MTRPFTSASAREAQRRAAAARKANTAARHAAIEQETDNWLKQQGYDFTDDVPPSVRKFAVERAKNIVAKMVVQAPKRPPVPAPKPPDPTDWKPDADPEYIQRVRVIERQAMADMQPYRDQMEMDFAWLDWTATERGRDVGGYVDQVKRERESQFRQAIKAQREHVLDRIRQAEYECRQSWPMRSARPTRAG